MCNKTDNLPVITLDSFNASAYGFTSMSIRDFFSHSCQKTQPYKASFFTIIFCSSKGGKVWVDRHELILNPHSAVCIGANSVLRFESESEQEGHVLLFSNIFLTGRYAQIIDLTDYYSKVYYKNLSPQEIAVWSFYMDQISELYAENSPKSTDLLLAHLHIIISGFHKHSQLRGHSTGQSEKNRKVMALEHLVEKHYTQHKLPSFYAKELYISVNYLNRICNETKGMSSGEIIRQRIMLEAERLLNFTTKPISEISEELGFESISYFSTFFKKHRNVAPEIFRRQAKWLRA